MSGPIANTYAPPEWLTQDFLQTALREGGRRGSLSVITCTIKPATNVGDNYLSQMFRAALKVRSGGKSEEELSVIIKCMPEGEATGEFIHEMKFFTRETKMLAETLPLMQHLLDEIGGKKLYAHLYYKQDGANTTLVMEDLCASGFRTVDRLAGLDIDHSLLVMEYIASFHAASLAAIDKNPEIKTTYEQGFWQRHNEVRIKGWIDNDINGLVSCLNRWNNFPVELIRKVERWTEISVKKLYQCTDLKEMDEMNVLTHADLWISNIMFKYEKDLPVDLRFVDFQLSCFNSAALDLHTFIFTSSHIDIRLSRIDEMLTRYHDKLVETCSRLKYPLKITLEDTKKIFYDRMAFGFIITIVYLSFIITSPADTNDLNEYLDKGEKDAGDNLVKNEKYKKVMETILPFFDQHGVFDNHNEQ